VPLHSAASFAANWESISTFAPVREGGEDKSEEWRSTKLGRYYPYYGRGYVPLTWHHNYKKYSNLLGGDCNLVSIPDLALRPEIALYVLVHGMSTGAFTGAKLATYVNASKVDYVGARRVTKLPLQGLKGFDAPEMVALSAEVWNNSYNSEICIGL
jgi:hypothetical protein